MRGGLSPCVHFTFADPRSPIEFGDWAWDARFVAVDVIAALFLIG